MKSGLGWKWALSFWNKEVALGGGFVRMGAALWVGWGRNSFEVRVAVDHSIGVCFHLTRLFLCTIWAALKTWVCIVVEYLKEPGIRDWDVSKVYLWEFGEIVFWGSFITRSAFHSGNGGLGTIEDCVFYGIWTHLGGRGGSGVAMASFYIRLEVGCWIQILCATTWADLAVYILVWVCMRGELVRSDRVHVGQELS